MCFVVVAQSEIAHLLGTHKTLAHKLQGQGTTHLQLKLHIPVEFCVPVGTGPGTARWFVRRGDRELSTHQTFLISACTHPALPVCVGCVMLRTSCHSKLFPQVIMAIPLPLVKIPLLRFQDRKKGIEHGSYREAQPVCCLPYLSGIQMWSQRRLDAGYFSGGSCGDDLHMLPDS